ncbi:hypothetical protein PMI41_02888 [Phyllobacterium sp. YR531]|nr:hypothetical protein PMI41_02888 [Phyllobacterium sp. YR531]
MAKFYIIDQPEVDKLWLVNADTNSVECLDRDLLESLGTAGCEFLSSISDLMGDNKFSAETRSDPSERAFSFDGRSDASDRAFSCDGRSNPSDRAFSFSGRSDVSDRAFSFGSEKNVPIQTSN